MKNGNTTYQEIQLACHPGRLLAGVSLGYIRRGNEQVICIGKKTAGDPGQKPSGMTTYFNNIPLIRTSSTFPLDGEGAPSTWSTNVGQVLPDNRSCFCPPCGESAPLGAKGGLIKRAFFAPPSALQATSSAREEGNRGFTLIELLVVVLIIGILAAIALPQYQRAVGKTRFYRLRAMATPLAESAQMYYLTHGDWPSKFDQLDIKLPLDRITDDCVGDENVYCCITYPVPNSYSGSVLCGRNDRSLGFSYRYSDQQGKYEVDFSCKEKDTERVCKFLPGATGRNPNAFCVTPDGHKGCIHYRID